MMVHTDLVLAPETLFPQESAKAPAQMKVTPEGGRSSAARPMPSTALFY